jgi:TonB-linked SusC/RagA family outer membrane protein
MKKNDFTDLFLSRRRLKILIMMKMFAFLTLALTLSASASSFSQNQKVSLEFEDAKILEVFNEIKIQTGLRFIYNSDRLDDLDAVSIDVENTEVGKVLNKIFEDSDLECRFKDNVIMVVEKLQVEQEQKQEDRIIKGTVTDENGETIPGVSVVVKGTNIGVSTDIDGNYILKIPESGGVLVFSFVGMKMQEIQLKEGNIVNAVMVEDSAQLSEVVVTGYQVLSKERVTGSYAQVKSEDLDKESSLDVTSKLEGKMTGLLVDKNSDGSLKILIRGQSTLKALSEPLIVVDGLPIEGSLSDIEANDIKSINVLKDASAASIWGTRAANGVIVIETKGGSGLKETNKINVNYSTTIGGVNDLSDLQLASSSDLVDFEYLSFFTGFIKPSTVANLHSPVSPVYQLLLDKPADLSSQLDALRKIDHSKQVEKYLMQRSIIHQAGVSFENATTKNSFYASLNTKVIRENMVGNSSNRFNLNLKNYYSLTDDLTFKLALNTTFQNRILNGISTSAISGRKPYELIMGENGEYLPQTYGHHQAYIDPLQDLGYINWDYNLKKEIDNYDNTQEILDNRFNVSLNYNTPIKGLNLSTSFLYQVRKNIGENIANQSVYNTADFINKYTLRDETTGELDHTFPVGSILTNTNNPLSTHTFRNIASYTTILDEGKHYISAMGGFEVREATWESSKVIHAGYDDRSLQYQDLDLEGRVPTYSGDNANFPVNSFRSIFSYRKERHLSYFTNLGYTYLDRYSLTASARIDQTNLFGVDKRFRYNPLWSVGFKWAMTQEDFFPDYFNRLDLRLSYGFTGTVDHNAKSFATARFATNIYGQKYLQMQSPKNNDLSFEKTGTFNIGVDYAFLQNKLYGTLEYFTRESTDVLGAIQNDATTGWNSILSNYANISNKGVEMEVNALIIDQDDLKLRLGVNYTFVKNELTKIKNAQNTARLFIGGGPDAAQLGQPISALYNYRSAGINSTGDYQTYDKEGNVYTGADASTLFFEDLVNSGQITPKYFGGISAGLEYKKFKLDLLVSYKGGHVSRMPIPNYGHAGSIFNTHESIAKSWRLAGDENKPGILPAMLGTTSTQSTWIAGAFNTDKRVFDATSLRLKTIVLSYSTSFGAKNKNKIQFFAEMKNVWVWTKNDLDIDPDFINPYTGQLRFTDPRSYTLGFKLNL